MHTTLVPVDGSTHSLKALHIACDLTAKYGGRIMLLHVLRENMGADELLALGIANAFGPKLTAALQAAALQEAANKASGPAPKSLHVAVGKKILDQAAGKVRRLDLEFKILKMVVGDPAEKILIAQKQTGASAIVMGCRGVSDRTDASSFGSVSNTVFEKAVCTCLSVK